MKKLLALALMVLMLTSLFGCSTPAENDPVTEPTETPAAETPGQTTESAAPVVCPGVSAAGV
ncbi:MAG TPA: aliphatic sulfonate ABC transporter substrate-binding protein, partial [Clostridia bacterium]|nr:aliphatic sulfonate ABC transporter substrate-binding protein [Clostridia bacterium]